MTPGSKGTRPPFITKKDADGEAKRIPMKGSTGKGKKKRKVVKRRPREKSWAEYKSSAQVMDVARYVASSSGAGQKVMVSPIHGCYAFACSPVDLKGRTGYQVYVPYWGEYTIPLDEYDKWRLYRKSVWHEGRHAADTPEEMFKQRILLGNIDPDITRQILNVIEDKRIEDRGVRHHPGMRAERIYANAYHAYARPHMSVFQEGPMAGTSRAHKAELLEAFLQRVLLGKVKGEMSDPAMRQWVEDSGLRVEEELDKLKDVPEKDPSITKTLVDLVKEVAIMLHLNELEVTPPAPSAGTQGSRQTGEGEGGEAEGEPGGEGEEGEPGEGGRPGERVRDPEEIARQQMGEDRWDEIVEEAEEAIENGDVEKFEELQKEVQEAIEKAIEEGKAELDESEYGESGAESSESGEAEADDFTGERDEADDFLEGGEAGGRPPEGEGERPPQEGGEPSAGAGEGAGPQDFDVDPTKLDEWYKEKMENDDREVPMIDVDESSQSIEPDHGGDPKEAKKTVEEFLKQLKKEAQEQGREEREDGDASDEVYADDIDRAETGNIESLSEYKKISGEVEQDKVEGTEEFPPVMEVGDFEPYIDTQFRRDMNERLKEWQVGKSVEYRKTSGRVNVPSYVRTGRKVPFRKMHRRSVKGQKYLFVVDMSGSIISFQEDYKKALVNTFETLDGIGAKIAVFGFGGVSIMGTDVTGQFRVKAFEEGKWKPLHSGKMANVKASGGTPLAPALEGLRKYIKKHRPTYVISVTDAAPDSEIHTQRVIETIKKENHRRVGMVAFGLTEDTPAYKEQMSNDLKELGYDRNFTSGKVEDIPEELVELIAPTR